MLAPPPVASKTSQPVRGALPGVDFSAALPGYSLEAPHAEAARLAASADAAVAAARATSEGTPDASTPLLRASPDAGVPFAAQVGDASAARIAELEAQVARLKTTVQNITSTLVGATQPAAEAGVRVAGTDPGQLNRIEQMLSSLLPHTHGSGNVAPGGGVLQFQAAAAERTIFQRESAQHSDHASVAALERVEEARTRAQAQQEQAHKRMPFRSAADARAATRLYSMRCVHSGGLKGAHTRAAGAARATQVAAAGEEFEFPLDGDVEEATTEEDRLEVEGSVEEEPFAEDEAAGAEKVRKPPPPEKTTFGAMMPPRPVHGLARQVRDELPPSRQPSKATMPPASAFESYHTLSSANLYLDALEANLPRGSPNRRPYDPPHDRGILAFEALADPNAVGYFSRPASSLLHLLLSTRAARREERALQTERRQRSPRSQDASPR